LGEANSTFSQISDQTNIGFQKVVARHFGLAHPAHVAEDAILDLASELLHQIELQLYGSWRPVVSWLFVRWGRVVVVVPDGGDLAPDRRPNTQLFFQLALQSLLRFFARLDLAAGKLPLERHGLMPGALADQDFAVAHY